MNPPNFILFLAVLCFGLFENLFAQEAPPIVPGARIRVSAPSFSRDRLIGTVASKSADTLVVKVENGAAPLSIPLVSITRLEVSRGKVARGVNALKGAGIGLLVGAGVGVVAGLVIDDPQNNEITAGAWALFGAGVLGGAGLLTGGIVGFARSNERWKKVPLERVRLGLAPHDGRVALLATFAF